MSNLILLQKAKIKGFLEKELMLGDDPNTRTS
ncbi:hypothetical protein HNP68_001184 [Borrelia yangtzensis]|uniref:Uncharacterized protein n=1 Tax=Borreliella yangtzensis TaxID=683292 RepID=A0ABR6PBA9_9SPIR|nr:hypothetical protein [Borreliella yangtzensis]